MGKDERPRAAPYTHFSSRKLRLLSQSPSPCHIYQSAQTQADTFGPGLAIAFPSQVTPQTGHEFISLS